MRRTIDLDEELSMEVDRAAHLVKEKPATIIRLAIRAGLPSVTRRFLGPRPEGFFAQVYQAYPKERAEFEEVMAKGMVQTPE